MIKIQRKSQSGRSMVEMLGVLAIIGVLSVGGIAGYRTAMEMHAANELMDQLQKFYIATEGKRQALKKSDSLNLSHSAPPSRYGHGLKDDLGFDFILEAKYFYSIKNGVHDDGIRVISRPGPNYTEEAEKILKRVQEQWPFTDCLKRDSGRIFCFFYFDESGLF